MNSRLQILLLLLLLGLPCHAATGGPDSFGYCWIDSDEAGGPSPQWNEIRSLASPLPGADDQSIRIPLPGDFWFYGQMFDSINACSNGYLSFISQEAVAYPSPFPDTLPPDGTPDGTIAPFWADLVTTGGYWHYYYDSTASLFIVEWDSVIRFGTDVRYSFRAVLDFNDSSLAFVYHLADSGWQYDLTAINGIESDDGLSGITLERGLIKNDYAVRFYCPKDSHDAIAIGIISPAWQVEPESLMTPRIVVENGGISSENIQATCLIFRNDSLLYADTAKSDLVPPGDTAVINFAIWTAGGAGEIYRFTMFCDLFQDADRGNDSLTAVIVSFPYRSKLVSSWKQSPVVVDGIMTPGEWDSLTAVNISDILSRNGTGPGPGAACLYAQNDSSHLYLAVDAPGDTSLSAGDGFYLYVDEDIDGQWNPDGSEGRYQLEYTDRDSLTFYSLPGNTPYPVPGAWYGISSYSGRVQYEMAIPLGFSGITDITHLPGGELRVLAALDDGQDSSRFGWWPQPVEISQEQDPGSYGQLFLAQAPSGVAADGPLLPKPEGDFSLSPNIPNPFSCKTTIHYQLPARGEVQIKIFDISGRSRKIISSGTRPAGRHTAEWDGTDDHGNKVSNGIYFCRLCFDGRPQTRKMVVLR